MILDDLKTRAGLVRTHRTGSRRGASLQYLQFITRAIQVNSQRKRSALLIGKYPLCFRFAYFYSELCTSRKFPVLKSRCPMQWALLALVSTRQAGLPADSSRSLSLRRWTRITLSSETSRGSFCSRSNRSTSWSDAYASCPPFNLAYRFSLCSGCLCSPSTSTRT